MRCPHCGNEFSSTSRLGTAHKTANAKLDYDGFLKPLQDEIERLFRKGFDHKHIARSLKVTHPDFPGVIQPSSVRYVLIRLGHYKPKTKQEMDVDRKIRNDKILQLLNEKYSKREISKLLDCSLEAVNYAVHSILMETEHSDDFYELPVRAQNALIASGLREPISKDLVSKLSEVDLMRIPNVGKISVHAIKKWLSVDGYSLSVSVD